MAELTEKDREFLRAIESNPAGGHMMPGLLDGCEDCKTMDEEGEFRSHGLMNACVSCGNRNAGDRYPAHYNIKNGEIKHGNICDDCRLFHSNGDLPL